MGGPDRRPKSRQNDYGFSLGGPIRIPKLYNGRNKSFFFFNFEQYKQNNTYTCATCAVPTDNMRAGNFSDVLGTKQIGTDVLGRPLYQNEIFDPATARTVNVKGTNYVVTDPFPNNTIPSVRFNSVASKVQSLVPKTTTPGTTVGTNNWTPSVTYPKIMTVPAFKIDHVISQNLKGSFYYSQLNTQSPNSVDGLPYPVSAERGGTSNVGTYRLNVDYMATNNLLVHAGAGYTRFVNADSSPSSVYTYDAAGQLGLPGAFGPGFPHFGGLNTAYGGLTNGGGNGLGPTQESLYWMDHANGIASAIWTHKSHAIKIGSEFKNDMWIIDSQIAQAGSYNFSAAETAIPYNNSTSWSSNGNSGSIGFPWASFLLGQVDGGSMGNPMILQYHRPDWALYLQDTWRVNSRLTVDYGIRWDFTQTLHEHGFHTSGFSPTAINENAVGPNGPLLGGMKFEGYGPGRCNCDFMPHDPYSVGPRLGVAYLLNPETVVRGGFGITYGQAFPFDYAGSVFNAVSVGYNTLSFSAPTFGTANTTLSSGFQYSPSLITSKAFDPGASCCSSINNAPSPYFDPHGGTPPRIYSYTISIQREIKANLGLEVSWVGNRADHLLSGDQGNAGLLQLNALSQARLGTFNLNPTNPADAFALKSTFASGVPQSRGFSLPYATFPTGQTLAQALRPFPQYSNVYAQYTPTGKSWYDSLQVKLTKRMSHGLQLLNSFTWSKELEEGTDTERGRGAQINDALNRASNKFFTSTYAPFINVTSFTYRIPDLPFKFMVKSWAVRETLGGWTVGGIFRFANGQLLRIPGSNIASNNCTSATNCQAYPLSGILGRGTWANRVRGVPLFKFNPNSHDYGSTVGRAQGTTFLNAAAWAEPALGTFSNTGAYQNDYRWQRQPDEEMNLGKNFRIPMGRREPATLQVRAEFFNIFNHTYLPMPSSSNFETADSTAGVGTTSYLSSTGGFGRDNAAGIGNQSSAYRTGQLVARFQF